MRVHVHVERVTAHAHWSSERQLERLLAGAIARELGEADSAHRLPADAVADAVQRGVQAQVHGDGATGPRPGVRR